MNIYFCALILLVLHVCVFGDGKTLLFANRKDVRLFYFSDQKNYSTIILGDLKDAAAVDFFFKESRVFVTDVSTKKIKCIFLNGSSLTYDVITTGLVSPDGLACDWIGRNLYWTDSETDRIEVSNFDGSYRKVLYWQNLDQPRAVALDPHNGYIYWTDWGEVPKIERSSMDGNSKFRSVVVDTNIHWPNGLTLDYAESRIYWADAKLFYIHSVKFDGSDRVIVVDGKLALPHPYALSLSGDLLYWTDWSTRSINICNKHTGGDRRDVHTNIYSPMDIHVYSAERQAEGPNPCGVNNGGCSHLCLMSAAEPHFSCSCPTGIRLLSDGKQCAQGAEQLLLLARRTDLRSISLDTSDFTAVLLQLQDIKHAIAIDFDPIDDIVYWTDDEIRLIWRAKLDGSDQEIIVNTEVDHPDGIAVDWIARNLYWTDTGTDRIEVARLNGTSRKVLVAENLKEPRAIVLDPFGGMMYWTDWGSPPKIECANLDGSDRRPLINVSLGWPNGLAIDFEIGRIYWGDAKEDKIEMADLDGSNRKVLVSNHIPHIFGLSLLGNYIYWTDWQRRSIERVNKYTGKEREVIIEQLPDLMGLKAVNVNREEGSNACSHLDGGCSHLCLNRPEPKGYICACPMGLELLANQKTCITPAAFLMFSRQADIHRISLETSHNDVVIPLAGVKEAMALDFNFADNSIYWTDLKLKSISRAFINGSSSESVIQFGLEYPEGMAVDWIANNLYWADTGTKRIEVARLHGKSRRVLIWKNLENPRALVLDPPQGYMYWTDWCKDSPKIERATLDGSHRIVLISNVGRVNSLTIDYTEKRIYWTDLDSKMIESSDMNGADRRAVFTGRLPRPHGLTQYQDYIYWTDWQSKTIERADKNTGINRTLIQSGVEYVMDILVFHESRQSGWNSCGVKNGGCSDICIAHSVDYNSTFAHHCLCPTHHNLNYDNRSCNAPTSFLLFSQKNLIKRMLLDKDVPEMVLPINGLRNIKAIDFDPVERFVYWIDGRTKTIRRAKDDGSKQSVVLHNPSDIHQPYDIAIDFLSRHIFWSCSQHNVINVTRLEMSNVGVVIHGKKQRPRSVKIHSQKGWIFWTNMIDTPRIERANLDGSDRVIVISDLMKPTALAIDQKGQRLYWGDTQLKHIGSSDLDGLSRMVFLSKDVYFPTRITVFDDYLYWIDSQKNLMERVNKRNTHIRNIVLSRISHLSDIHGVNEYSEAFAKSHPCAYNKHCSHICLVGKNRKVECACPKNLFLSSDGHTCTEPPYCASDKFRCHSGSVYCIPYIWRCDGLPECDDKSDESDCPPCRPHQFRCRNGQCLEREHHCDGIKHCSDGGDEAECCASNQYKCSDFQCIGIELYCNGHYDCKDGSDEEGCCSNNYFRCKNVQCIPRENHCDGFQDCSDGSDEMMCQPTIVGKLSGATSSAPYTVAIVVVIVLILFVVAIFLYNYRRKGNSCDETQDIIMTKPLNPQSSIATVSPRTITFSQKSQTTCVSATSGATAPSTSYDRNHVTGASSSSSSAVQHYPKETLNPPPSPVTDRSQCNGDLYYSSNSPTTSRSFSKHHYKCSIPPPPTTPCSTDVCDDSEPYNSLHHCHKKCQYQPINAFLESEPHPPPPTPRTIYHSDDTSCPPSPCTERSFFNPYPPPPSPAGMSGN